MGVNMNLMDIFDENGQLVDEFFKSIEKMAQSIKDSKEQDDD